MNNPLDQIQSFFEDLTKTDKEIAIYIINNPHEVVTTNNEALVKKTGSSKSALSRFAQRIGYSGFTEFKYELARSLVSFTSNEEKDRDPIRVITKTYADYILKMADSLDRKQIERIAEVFPTYENIKIFGINRSYNSANQLKQRLTRIGYTNISSEGDTQVIADYLASSGEKDVIVIFSTTDNTKYFTSKIKEYAHNKAKFIFITANPSLPFKKLCYEYVVVPRISKDSYASFLDDQAIFFVFIEILMEAIVEKYKTN